MRAITLNYSRRELEERDVPEPEIGEDGDVLFRVKDVGICGTDRDLASFRIQFPPPEGDYLVLGHECVGEVLQTGSGVQSLRVGDTVVPLVRRPCAPPCAWCFRNRRDLCISGNYTERGIAGAHGYFTELAVDSESDLVRVTGEHAVLVEPLSVVEKAIAIAFRLHPGEPESALVLGAGTIGLLTAMALGLRGIATTICSLEPKGSERARLTEEIGARYMQESEGRYDMVIEAAGDVSAAVKGLQALAPSGIFVVLGVINPVELPMLQLVLGNQVIAGSVNASPAHFAAAVQDLAQFPAQVLRRMIHREPVSAFRSTLLGPPRPEPKIVHVICE